MPYSTPGERLAGYLRRTTFAELADPALRARIRLCLLEGQRADHLLLALDDIAVLNVARRLIAGAAWARTQYGEGPTWESYLTDLVVNELIIDYENIRKIKDYLRPCALAVSSDISARTRAEVLREHGLSCYMCGAVLARNASVPGKALATVDHVWPRSYGGDSFFENLLPACTECNNAKASMAVWSLFRFQYLVIGPHPSAREAESVGRQARIAWQLFAARRAVEADQNLSLKEALVATGPVEDIDLELRRFPTDFFVLDDYVERVE